MDIHLNFASTIEPRKVLDLIFAFVKILLFVDLSIRCAWTRVIYILHDVSISYILDEIFIIWTTIGFMYIYDIYLNSLNSFNLITDK